MSAQKHHYSYILKHYTSLRITKPSHLFAVRCRNWKPVPCVKREVVELTDHRIIGNNARDHYKAMQARRIQEQYEMIMEELQDVVDGLNGIKEQHNRLHELFNELEAKRLAILRKMSNIEIDTTKYFEAMVKLPDPMLDLDEVQLQKVKKATGQPSVVTLPNGDVVSVEEGYQVAPSHTSSGSSVPPYRPGGVGIGCREIKNAQKFHCPDCSRRFTKKCDMLNHRKFSCEFRAIKEKQFACTYCDRSFTLKVSCREHTAAQHTKIYLYFCKQCGSGFYYNRLAVTHRPKCDGTPINKGINEHPTPQTPPVTPQKSADDVPDNNNGDDGDNDVDNNGGIREDPTPPPSPRSGQPILPVGSDVESDDDA